MGVTTAEVVVALVAALGAAILTSLGGFAVASFNARRAAERDRRDDERRIRDSKRERLREDYVHLIRAGLTMDEVAAELLFVDEGKLSTERFARLDRALSKAKDDLDRSVARVMLESEASPVLETYEDIKAQFEHYGIALVHEERSPQDPQRSMGHLTQMRADVDQLKTRAREHLDSLGKAI
jgi:hypothetical protein